MVVHLHHRLREPIIGPSLRYFLEIEGLLLPLVLRQVMVVNEVLHLLLPPLLLGDWVLLRDRVLVSLSEERRALNLRGFGNILLAGNRFN